MEEPASGNLPTSADTETVSVLGLMDTQGRPTIKDVFLAVSNCNLALSTSNMHMGTVKANVSFIIQDL